MTLTRRRYATQCLLAAVVVAVAPQAWGQDAESEAALDIEQLSLDELLNPTITTATKSKRTLEQSPSIVTVFLRDDIERLGAFQLIDLLRQVPGFYEVSSQLERNVAIRGIHASSPYHFVVLLDGLPMNDFLFSSASPDNFTLEYAERVEIIRGPGSAIYGANALMGVINIITRKVEEGTRVHQTLAVGTDNRVRSDLTVASGFGGGRAFYSSFSFWRQGGTAFGVPASEDVVTPSLGQNISDGIQMGENLTGPSVGASTHVNEYGPSFNALLKYEHGDGSALRLLLTRSELALQRTYRQALYLQEPHTQRPVYINERMALDYEKRWGATDRSGQLTLRPSLLAFSHDMRSQSVSPRYYEAATREGTPVIYKWSGRDVRLSSSLEYSVDLPDFGHFVQTSIVSGVQTEYSVAADYRLNKCYVDRDRRFDPSVFVADDRAGAADLFCIEGLMLREGTTVDPFGTVRTSGQPRFGDGDEIRLGSFVQVTASFPHDVGLVLGGRVDSDLHHDPQFTPRVALVAPIAGGFYSKAQYSSSFVYPAFLYRTGNSLSDYQGNPDIQPQSIRTVEALIGFKSDWMRTELSGYYNDVSDFITYDLARNARTGQFLFSNQGDLRIVGLEATGRFRFLDNRLLLDVQGTFARPLDGTSSNLMVDGKLGGPTKYPELLGRATLSASPTPRLRLTLNGGFNSRVAHETAPEVRFDQITGSDGLPHDSRASSEFETQILELNASMSYTFFDRWRADLTGSNLLNQRVHTPGSVVVPYMAEGRRLTLGLTYQF